MSGCLGCYAVAKVFDCFRYCKHVEMWLWGVVSGYQGIAMQLLRCRDCFEYCKHRHIYVDAP